MHRSLEAIFSIDSKIPHGVKLGRRYSVDLTHLTITKPSLAPRLSTSKPNLNSNSVQSIRHLIKATCIEVFTASEISSPLLASEASC
ncbi:uncharacterized protein PHALS_14974 [Plasmopara halstedii]|uniref:Uncharacterized protein n=1 Tax=Plasmopara halstedii TaxID=4781 RepID=A0A0P1AXW5_PLAHL|nr:uncharacterized protein PHALS_14974 [Plasmopara halstedii]CEG47284.1 hypothetical protein PHALS_14974 [Plasmopara halstedii]|eukprot:XP_024583653.1 hypothetical protein PHALS_14974 [Plasmopara halstedii]